MSEGSQGPGIWKWMYGDHCIFCSVLGLSYAPWADGSSHLDLRDHVLGKIQLQLRVPPLHVLQLLVSVLQVNPELGLQVLDLFPALSQVLGVDQPLFNLEKAQWNAISSHLCSVDSEVWVVRGSAGTVRTLHSARPEKCLFICAEKSSLPLGSRVLKNENI